MYGPPLAYSAGELRRLKFYTVPKSRRLRETFARLARELEGFVCSDETLKTKWKKEDHPRGQPDNPGQFVEKDNQSAQPVKEKTLFKQPDSSDRSVPENTPSSRVGRKVPDYASVGFEEAVRQEFRYLRELTEQDGNEHMSIMTKGKKILGTWKGSAGKINEDEEIKSLLENSPANSLSLLHTHTKNIGFSGVDLGTMAENPSVKDIKAQTPDGAVYYGSVGVNGERLNAKEVVSVAYEELSDLLKLPRYANMKPNDVREAAVIRERNSILQKRYKWDLR